MLQTTQEEKTQRLLTTNEEIRLFAHRAREVERLGNAATPHYLGWSWHEIPIPQPKLKALVEEGLVKINYESRSSKNYLLRCPEVVDDVLAHAKTVAKMPSEEKEALDGDLFQGIIGHEEVKRWALRSLTSEEPVHLLLSGPPATAKTLFLDAFNTLEGSYFALGGTASKNGLADFLINFQPRYLIIDELDKMGMQDFSVLLSLMQSGRVVRTKKGLRDQAKMTTWVFAGCNSELRIPPELRSRFLTFRFQEYTQEEFEHIVLTLLTARGKPEDLARHIAAGVRTHDVRQALHLGRLCSTLQDVDELLARL